MEIRNAKTGEAVRLGSAVRRVDAVVAFKRAGALREAVVLDGNGYLTERRAEIEMREGRGLRIQLPADSLYTLVR